MFRPSSVVELSSATAVGYGYAICMHVCMCTSVTVSSSVGALGPRRNAMRHPISSCHSFLLHIASSHASHQSKPQCTTPLLSPSPLIVSTIIINPRLDSRPSHQTHTHIHNQPHGIPIRGAEGARRSHHHRRMSHTPRLPSPSPTPLPLLRSALPFPPHPHFLASCLCLPLERPQRLDHLLGVPLHLGLDIGEDLDQLAVLLICVR